MGTFEKKDSHKKRTPMSAEDKLERDLKDCMHCKFFWGHNNRCANGICVKPTKKKEISIPDVIRQIKHCLFRHIKIGLL